MVLVLSVQRLTDSASEIVHLPYETAYGRHFEETRRRVPDISRARDVLGSEARISLEEGLPQTLAWFQKTPEEQQK